MPPGGGGGAGGGVTSSSSSARAFLSAGPSPGSGSIVAGEASGCQRLRRLAHVSHEVEELCGYALLLLPALTATATALDKEL